MATTMIEGQPQQQSQDIPKQRQYAQLTHVRGYELQAGTLGSPRETLRPNGQKENIERVKTGFTPELVADYTSYMHDHMEFLLGKSKSMSQQEFNDLLSDESFQSSKMLLQKLTKVKEGSGGKDREFDEDTFKKFMETDQGMTIAYAIRSRNVERKAAGLGAILTMAPEAHRPGAVQEESYVTADGRIGWQAVQGVRRWWNKPWTGINGRQSMLAENTPLRTKGRVAATIAGHSAYGAIGGGFVGGPPGSAVGAVIPLGVAGINYAMRRGETIDIRHSPDALRLMQSSPQEKIWLKTQGIDVDDFEPDPANPTQIRMRTGITPGTVIPKEELAKQLAGDAAALLSFQEAVGVTPEQRSPMDTSFLYEGRDAPPQQGLAFQAEVIKRFKDKGGRDPGNLPTSINRYREAYSEALKNEIQRAFKNILTDTVDHRENLLTEIEGKKGAKGSDSKAAKKELLTLNHKEKALEKEEHIYRTEPETLGQYLNGFATLAAHEAAKRAAESRVQGNPNIPAEAALLQVLTQLPAQGGQIQTITVDGLPISSIPFMIQDAEKKYDEALDSAQNYQPTKGEPQDTVAKKIEAAKKVYEERLTRIGMLQKKVQEVLTQINATDGQINQLQENLSDNNNETRKGTETTIASMSKAKRDIESLSVGLSLQRGRPAPPIDLSDHVLQTESFEEIMNRINAVHVRSTAAGTPPKGWDASENDKTEHRLIVLHAMAETRAETRMNPSSVGFKDAVDRTRGWALQESDLLTLPIAEIQNKMNARRSQIGRGSIPSEDQIIQLKREAFARLPEKQKALQEVFATQAPKLTEQRQKIATQKEKIGREGVPTHELAAIKKFAARYGDIWTTVDRADLQEFLSAGRVDRTRPDDERLYAAYEDGQSKAYVQMLGLMLDHRHDEELEYDDKKGPEAALERAMQLIPKDRLSEELTKYFDLTMPGSLIPPASFDQALRVLRGRMGLTPGTPTIIQKEDLSMFFSEHMLYEYLKPKVATL